MTEAVDAATARHRVGYQSLAASTAAPSARRQVPTIVSYGRQDPLRRPRAGRRSTAVAGHAAVMSQLRKSSRTPSYLIDFGPGVVRRIAAASLQGVKGLTVGNVRVAFPSARLRRMARCHDEIHRSGEAAEVDESLPPSQFSRNLRTLRPGATWRPFELISSIPPCSLKIAAAQPSRLQSLRKNRRGSNPVQFFVASVSQAASATRTTFCEAERRRARLCRLDGGIVPHATLGHPLPGSNGPICCCRDTRQ